MRRLATLAILAIATTASLSACSSVEHGTVTGKEHVSSFTYYQNQCFAYSSKGLCTMDVPIPVTQPDMWDLDLRDSQGHTGTISVSQQTFERISVGDQY